MKARRICNEKVFVLVAILLGIFFSITTALAYSRYLDLRFTDALAMVHVLFPSYFLILFLQVLLCVVFAIRGAEKKHIHIIMLIELSLMLWFTPFYLSGFSRHTDGIYNTAVSAKLPEVLHGVSPSSTGPDFYRYANEYPGSFVFNYVAIQLANIDVFAYSRLIYPFFCAIAISVLWYIFTSRLFSPRVGFLATTIAMLGQASLPEIHPSPHSLGTLLVIAAAILLLTFKGVKSTALGLVIAFVCILTHPISPIILLFFLVAPYFAKIFLSDSRVPLYPAGLAGIFSGWFAWAFYNSSGTAGTIAQSIYDIVTLKFAARLEQVSGSAVSTTGAMFPTINLLDKILTLGLILLSLVLIFRVLVGLDFRKGIKSLSRQIGKKMGFGKLLMLSTAFLCFVFAYLMVFANIAPGTGSYLERGYTWFVFTIATFIAAEITTSAPKRPHGASAKNYVRVFVLAWFLFVAIVYPIVAYQTESSSGYPPSEGVGLKFVASHAPLNETTISIFPASQLIPYVSSETHFYYPSYNVMFSVSTFMGFGSLPPPDIIVFRRTTYFRVALTYDLSFDNNRYTRTIDQINNSTYYDKTYSNPSFDVYTWTDYSP